MSPRRSDPLLTLSRSLTGAKQGGMLADALDLVLAGIGCSRGEAYTAVGADSSQASLEARPTIQLPSRTKPTGWGVGSEVDADFVATQWSVGPAYAMLHPFRECSMRPSLLWCGRRRRHPDASRRPPGGHGRGAARAPRRQRTGGDQPHALLERRPESHPPGGRSAEGRGGAYQRRPRGAGSSSHRCSQTRSMATNWVAECNRNCRHCAAIPPGRQSDAEPRRRERAKLAFVTGKGCVFPVDLPRQTPR